MCVDRRGFMQIAAGAASLSLLPERGWAEETPIPDAVKNLKSRLDGVVPIADDERKGRIAKAQRLMKENGLGATYVESGSSLFYYTGVRWGRSERMFTAVVRDRERRPACAGITGGGHADHVAHRQRDDGGAGEACDIERELETKLTLAELRQWHVGTRRAERTLA